MVLAAGGAVLSWRENALYPRSCREVMHTGRASSEKDPRHDCAGRNRAFWESVGARGSRAVGGRRVPYVSGREEMKAVSVAARGEVNPVHTIWRPQRAQLPTPRTSSLALQCQDPSSEAAFGAAAAGEGNCRMLSLGRMATAPESDAATPIAGQTRERSCAKLLAPPPPGGGRLARPFEVRHCVSPWLYAVSKS